MNKKKTTILISIIIALIAILAGYLFWANQKADYYASSANKTPDKQTRILDLEKSITLWRKSENIFALADLYISVGRNDLAEKIMFDRGEVDILNKLGNLYLAENKIEDAENTFTKAKTKNINPDSLKGLILVELKKGDRGVAENYLTQLSGIDSDSADCYSAFVNLNDFKKAKDNYTKAKSCTLYSLNKYIATHNETQNPLYLKLEAANLYYSQNYLNLAEKDILTLLKAKNNYRDANVLASRVYEKLGNQTKATEHTQKALEIDPVAQ